MVGRERDVGGCVCEELKCGGVGERGHVMGVSKSSGVDERVYVVGLSKCGGVGEREHVMGVSCAGCWIGSGMSGGKCWGDCGSW